MVDIEQPYRTYYHPVKGDGPSVEIRVALIHLDVHVYEVFGTFQAGGGVERYEPSHFGVRTVIVEELLSVGFPETAEGKPLCVYPYGADLFHVQPYLKRGKIDSGPQSIPFIPITGWR